MLARRHLILANATRQRGASMVFIAVGLAAILIMAGLALDAGHTMLNKSRLQNATDAAALAAAKIFDDSKSTTLGGVEAATAFQRNASTTGNQELSAAYANGTGNLTLTVQWSPTLNPFTPTSPAVGPYVRVIASGFIRPTFLLGVAGIPTTTVGATAVAGPSPSINQACNLVPMMACGNTNTATGGGAANNWGYVPNAPTIMKLAAPGGSGTPGPGNFQLVNLGSPGANAVRQELAGGYGACNTVGNTLTTQPGDETGPVADGLDTRFGVYKGSLGGSQAQYPPDVITTEQSPALTVNTSSNGCTTTPCIQQGNNGPIITASNINLIFSYQNYLAELPIQADWTNAPSNYSPPGNPPGQFNRRILTIPIADCSGGGGGATNLPILGFGCFFLLQQPTHQGNTDWVLGQFIGTCDVNGTPGPAPSSGPQPYIIQLYRDPNSGDS
jgi:Flp pilus assembly protein TadG